ncbi:hypothetical protein E1262_02175 [Jiangella aurantiaca]|uniref:Rhamnogalacturonase A/B/Epimerase-like pectate lyase domain-containing protein n=2 Tax=Jiangella aurantiaca TaxID=2530373 RepID=A0A4R5AM66_9ACTN|nr:hypothetical protein E1262_02175 [Jiangella aurantiaca]
MSHNDRPISRARLLAGIGATGAGIAGASVLQQAGSSTAAASPPSDWANVKIDHGAKGDGTTDDTAAIQAAVDTAATAGTVAYFPPGTYKVTGTIHVAGASIHAAFGAVIKHQPADDTTDCMVITGLNAGRTKISGLQIKGLQDGHGFGRDLVRVAKGDYVTLDDLYLDSAKRDAVHVEPGQSFFWIENMLLVNVKIQSPRRDAFHYAIPAGLTDVFINQTTMINCESRAAARHALALINSNEGAASNKISCLKVVNCELAGTGSTSEPLARLSGSINGGTVENISFEDSAVEDTTATRTGDAVLISGKVNGLFRFENSIHYGTVRGITGLTLFPHYFYRNIFSSASVPLYSSHMGLYRKYRTATLAQGAHEDTYQLQGGEILKGYVLDRYNNEDWYAEFTCLNTSALVVAAQNNVVVSLSGSTIRLTNTSSTATSLELFLLRMAKDTAF